MVSVEFSQSSDWLTISALRLTSVKRLRLPLHIAKSSSDGPRKVVCERALAVMICACIVLAVVLVPDSSELARRVVADGNTERIHELAQQALDDTTNPAAPQSSAQKLRQLAAKATLASYANPAVRAEFLQLCASADSPLETLIELGTQRPNLPDDLCPLMAESLAQHALGLGKPKEAAIIYTTLLKQYEHADALHDAVKCWRWAAQPARALALIDELAATAPRELLELRPTLALESNQPNRAYDLAFAAYGQGAHDDRGKALLTLVALAHTGDRFEKATPLLHHHLAGFPFTRQTLPDAILALQAGTHFSSPQARAEFLELGAHLGHWYEWAEPPQPEPALDIYFKLALLGDEDAYTRCKDLYPDLLRSDDFITVLSYLVAQGQHHSDEPLLAQLLAEAGQTHLAALHLRAIIDRQRDAPNTAQWRSLAEIYVDTADAQQSLEPLQKLIQQLPQEPWAHQQLANTYVQLGRFLEAMPVLAHLVALTPTDSEALESYYSLADSLAQPQAAADALAKLIAVPSRQPAVDDYLDLARLYKNLDQAPASLLTLRTGFERFSASPRMRMSLAENLSEERPTETLALLCHPSLKDNTEAIKLLAETALRTPSPQVALDFLDQYKPKCLADLPVARLQLSLAHERVGDTEQAARLLDQLLTDPRFEHLMAWQTLAQTALDMGDNERAERFQERYVTYHGINDSKAWNLLGDIYTLRGKTTEATAAYARSLRSLVPTKKNRTLAEAPLSSR